MGNIKDITGNNEISAACADWLEAKKQLLKWQAIEKEAKLKIINACNRHQVNELIVGDYEVTLSERKGSEGRVIGLEDVGTTINARKASQTIKINEIER